MAPILRSRPSPAVVLRASSALLVVALLVLAGCADGAAEEADTATPTATPTAAATAATGAAPETSSAAPTDPVPTGTEETAAAATSAGLPGEDVDGPEPGAVLAVVGVAADDVLNVRDAPGTGGAVLGELDPLADDVTVTGRARSLDGGLWYQIEGGAAGDGWVNARYLAHLGDTTDITSELPERPQAETLVDLADILADERLPAGGEGDGPRVVVSDGPFVGDLGEVTIDIVGLPDDAIIGERLHLFAQPTDGGEGFVLRTVERTLLCARGVSDGLCV